MRPRPLGQGIHCNNAPKLVAWYAIFWYAMKSQLTKAKIHQHPWVGVYHLARSAALNQPTLIEITKI